VKGYVCVYRHSTPLRRHRARTEQVAANLPLLHRYLDRYDQDDCFYDWGDDPSFFVAGELLGDAAHASWGVCRRDVRARVSVGDFIVFVCARQSSTATWEYFFVGLATLALPLTRQTIWADDRYSAYRRFFNILARTVPDGSLERYEHIHKFHDDWENRCTAPYWVFDPELSLFNLTSPLHVASYHGQPRAIERWRTSDERAKELRALLLRGAKSTRGLRTTNGQRAHPPLNLGRGYPSGAQLHALRTSLLGLVASYR
jgi:hypothetical protein